MGRYTTGIVTTREVKRIELKELQANGVIKKGFVTHSQYSWSSGCSIGIVANLEGANSYIRLSYVTTDSKGHKEQYDYKVQLVSVPSNLGKGEVYYFLCPVTDKRCRILYKAYGCDIWKSRNAYQNRIYYSSQLSSHKGRFNDKYWRLDRELEEMRNKRRTSTYKGKPTKRALLYDKKLQEQYEADQLRWSLFAMPVRLQKLMKSKT